MIRNTKIKVVKQVFTKYKIYALKIIMQVSILRTIIKKNIKNSKS